MLRTLASRWNKEKFTCYEVKIQDREKASRIFHSTPNGVLMAHTEWLPGVQLRHFSPTCAVHMEERIVGAGGCPVVVAQW